MKIIKLLLVTMALAGVVFGGTTGKIRGRVVDTEGNPMIGANVVLAGTSLGAATDIQGTYFILNVGPGTYTVTITMIGYKTVIMSTVEVQTDLTTTLDATMEISSIAGETVQVTFTRPLIKNDATASAAIISSDVIESAPIESFQAIVQTKAGVTVDAGGDLHFRGGRSNEILYMIDGVPNVNPYDSGLGVDVSTNAIQELSVITGSFSAEYGQAMSGVVNIITKEGSADYHGSVSYMGGDLVADYDLDISPLVQDVVNPYEFGHDNELEASLSGPILPGNDKLRFLVSLRKNHIGGHLYGISRYNTVGGEKDSADWKPFTLNAEDKTNLQAKLSYTLNRKTKLVYSYISEESWYQDFNTLSFRSTTHRRKYIEDGHLQNEKSARTHLLKLTQQFNDHSFFDLSYSLTDNDYRQFAYEDAYDSRLSSNDYYVTDANYEFYTGGTQNDRTIRALKTNLAKLSYTNQITNRQEIKAGFEAKFHKLDQREYYMIVDKRDEPYEDTDGNGNYSLGEDFTDLNGDGKWNVGDDLNGDGINGNIKEVEGNANIKIDASPREFSGYILDKIELSDMVLNIGVRWDYFDTMGEIATDWNDPDTNSTKPASIKQQFSPRFSLAYPVSDRGKLFFSYGHFFQMPSYERIYTNPKFYITPTSSISSDIGNADIKPQKTISYEIGFEHQVGIDAAVFIKLFYRDMRNLLGQRVYVTPTTREYTLFINRSWGNTKGFTFSFEKRMSRMLSGSIDYTYMIARGNESDPTRTRRDYRLKIEPQKKIVFLEWDQTHAFRFNLNMAKAGSWSISTIGRLESGYPYTPTDANALIRIAEENSGRKPAQVHLDVSAFKHFRLNVGQGAVLTLFAKAYNILDIRNENYVHNNSGSARYSLGRYGDDSTPEYINRSYYYSKPRQLNLGLSVSF